MRQNCLIQGYRITRDHYFAGVFRPDFPAALVRQESLRLRYPVFGHEERQKYIAVIAYIFAGPTAERCLARKLLVKSIVTSYPEFSARRHSHGVAVLQSLQTALPVSTHQPAFSKKDASEIPCHADYRVVQIVIGQQGKQRLTRSSRRLAVVARFLICRISLCPPCIADVPCIRISLSFSGNEFSSFRRTGHIGTVAYEHGFFNLNTGIPIRSKSGIVRQIRRTPCTSDRPSSARPCPGCM